MRNNSERHLKHVIHRSICAAQTLVVVSVLALAIGLARPADVAAQTATVSTKFKYVNSNGAIGEVEALQFESAFTVSPITVFLLTDIILTVPRRSKWNRRSF
jgi:hypothetical protein